jgi:NADH pyrophosphatase NudC (nudix superfamily)
MKDTFCDRCGARYDLDYKAEWPKKCRHCNHEAWDNPLPVVVCVQPLTLNGRDIMGLVSGLRAIEPRKGGWALIGGHIENGETVEEAAVREFREETSVEIGANLRITGSYANGKGHMLIAVQADPMDLTHFADRAKPCPENERLGCIIHEHLLCFPIHKTILSKWWLSR